MYFCIERKRNYTGNVLEDEYKIWDTSDNSKEFVTGSQLYSILCSGVDVVGINASMIEFGSFTLPVVKTGYGYFNGWCSVYDNLYNQLDLNELDECPKSLIIEYLRLANKKPIIKDNGLVYNVSPLAYNMFRIYSEDYSEYEDTNILDLYRYYYEGAKLNGVMEISCDSITVRNKLYDLCNVIFPTATVEGLLGVPNLEILGSQILCGYKKLSLSEYDFFPLYCLSNNIVEKNVAPVEIIESSSIWNNTVVDVTPDCVIFDNGFSIKDFKALDCVFEALSFESDELRNKLSERIVSFYAMMMFAQSRSGDLPSFRHRSKLFGETLEMQYIKFDTHNDCMYANHYVSTDRNAKFAIDLNSDAGVYWLVRLTRINSCWYNVRDTEKGFECDAMTKFNKYKFTASGEYLLDYLIDLKSIMYYDDRIVPLCVEGYTYVNGVLDISIICLISDTYYGFTEIAKEKEHGVTGLSILSVPLVYLGSIIYKNDYGYILQMVSGNLYIDTDTFSILGRTSRSIDLNHCYKDAKKKDEIRLRDWLIKTGRATIRGSF